jgi:Tol biopolymer transport system component
MPLAPGTKLGVYELIGPLGAGGMGEVWRARDTRLQRDVAIKVLPEALATEPERLGRLMREAQALASLNHPNIAQIHGLEESGGVRALVMELVDGDDLSVLIARGAMPFAEALPIARQIAEALEAAHEQGIIHRDLKPANVKVRRDGAVKVLDFGLAKVMDPLTSGSGGRPGGDLGLSPTLTAQATRAGVILGTAAYMSPEQARGRAVDRRADVWAFGAVLYEMLTGRLAFEGEDISLTLANVLKQDVDWSALPPDLPPGLRRLLRRCLEKDPRRRLASMADARLELDDTETAGAEWGGGAAGSNAWAGGGPGAPTGTLPARRGVSIWLALGLAVAAFGLAIATTTLGILYHRVASKEPQVVRAFVQPPEKGSFRFIGGGNLGPATLSPDGRMLAFSAQGADGIQALYVRPLDASTPRLLAGTTGAGMPFWSPDSRNIGFYADGQLKRIAAAGGPAMTLCDVGVIARGGTWNKDGVIVFAPGPNDPLQRINEGGGKPTPVTTLDTAHGESSHRWPVFLPDGKHFLFFVRLGALGTSNENNGIQVGSLDGSPHKVLLRAQTNAAYASGYLLYLRDTTLMAQPFDPDRLAFSGEAVPIVEEIQTEPASGVGVFTASGTVLAYQTGTEVPGGHLFWRDRAGKQTGVLGDPATYMDVSLSRDRQKLAVSVLDPKVGPPDLWIYDLARGLRSRFTFDPGADRWPVWSPDGTRIAFSSNRRGRFNLYMRSYAGSGVEEPILESDRDKVLCDWSPDGRHLLFETRSDPNTRSDVWALPLDGDRKPFPVLQTAFRELEAVFSPDGRWIAYNSDESGRSEIYVTPFPGPGRKWQVSPSGGLLPRWSRTGKEIFFIGPGERINVAEVTTQGDTFEVGRTQPLFDVRGQRPGNVYDVTPDGQRFLVNTASDQLNAGSVTLVVNWPAALRPSGTRPR